MNRQCYDSIVGERAFQRLQQDMFKLSELCSCCFLLILFSLLLVLSCLNFGVLSFLLDHCLVVEVLDEEADECYEADQVH